MYIRRTLYTVEEAVVRATVQPRYLNSVHVTVLDYPYVPAYLEKRPFWCTLTEHHKYMYPYVYMFHLPRHARMAFTYGVCMVGRGVT